MNVTSRRLFSLAPLLLAATPLLAGTLVQFRTVLGEIDVELLDRDKPATVKNFLNYVQSGYYQNVFLHRCVPGFVVQGGEYITINSQETNLFTANKVYVWPNFPAIANEYDVGPRISNTYGTIAMARVGGQTNSATSQWFFNLGNNAALDSVDGGFTVFGRVVAGTNVLTIFNNLALNAGVVDMRQWYPDTSFGTLFKEVPVLYLGSSPPRINDLIYVDVSLLRVQITPGANGERTITWNSVRDRSNFVEFTTEFPPHWQLLLTTNGTGGTLATMDSSPSSEKRFYRVRVDF
jgi:cyclophilin family peptidyl-prolyl cis-trans isomerase